MGTQSLDEKGQAIFTDRKCRHGLFCDERGNNACERCHEAGRTVSFKCGISSGLEQAALKIRKQAGEFFAKGDDANARVYRLIAEDLDKDAKAAEDDFRKYQKEQEKDA